MNKEIQRLEHVLHEQNKIISKLMSMVENFSDASKENHAAQSKLNHHIREAVVQLQKDFYGEKKVETKKAKKIRLTIVKP